MSARLCALAAALAAVIAAATPGRAAETLPSEVVLGFCPAENAEELQSSAAELARLLSDRIHVPVRAYVALDYTALVEAMRSGQVHFAWLTPAPLVLAERLFDARVLLTQVRGGNPTYFGAIVVRADSPVHDAAELRGKTIAWVDPQSTSGYVVPRYLLLSRGIDPARTFRQQMFAGGHDSAVLAVQSGQVDAAAVWADPPAAGSGAWTRFSRAGTAPLRPILYTPPMPSDAVATTPAFADHHPLLVRAVTSALVDLGHASEGRAILHRLNGTDGFVPADAAQYAFVRRAFEASRSTAKSSFERPWNVALFFVCVALVAVAALPWWRRAPRARSLLAWLIFAGAVGWSFAAEQLAFGRLYTNRAAMWSFVSAMFPPDRGVLAAVVESAVVTVQLALIGTVLAVPLALVLGFLSAQNVVANRFARQALRVSLNFNRSIDTLIVALILVSAVGLGPLPGVVALALNSVGGLAKPFYEALETVDPRPAEAMRSVGATRLQELRWGVWPQFAPLFISIVLFRFELNVRVSTVLGLVGAGGIGFLLITYMRGAEYAKVTVVIAAIVLLVMALDAVSTRLRKTVS